MKSLRIAALMLALGAFSICSLPAHAQQEVDPDHFEQPAAAHMNAQHSGQQAKAQHHSNMKVASKHSHKAHHYHMSA